MKFKLATRIRLGAAAGLVMTLAVGLFTRDMAQDIDREMTHVYAHALPATMQLSEAETAMWRLRFALAEFMLGDTEAQRQILADEGKWVALIDGHLAAYDDEHRNAEEREALADLRAAWLRLKEARPKFFDLWQARRREEAMQWRSLTVNPYAASVVRAFERQIAVERKHNEARRKEVAADSASDKFNVTLVGGGLLVMVIGGYWLAMRSLRPLVRLTASAERTIQEALGEEIGASSTGDEIDHLVESFNLMTVKLISRAEELERVHAELLRERESLEDSVAGRTAMLEAAVAESERQKREIAQRSEMAEMLQSCANVDEAKTVLLRFAQQLLPGSSGVLYLADASHAMLDLAVKWNHPADSSCPLLIDFDDCWSLRRAKPHQVPDAADPLLCPHLDGCLPHGASSLCLPLAAHGEIFGLLVVVFLNSAAEESAKRQARIAAAEGMAGQTALALASLRLREALREQTIHDALTGLYNRRFIEEALPRELARAQRGKQFLAVFMLDVDHFKRFNDDHGHEAGDAVLRALGRAMKDNCRQGDLACRFGGEEFTVILADTGLADGREWGERLMRRVRQMEVKTNGVTLPHVTVSLGLALYPDHGEDMETLLQAADLALYDAKHAGRDRLAVCGDNTPGGTTEQA